MKAGAVAIALLVASCSSHADRARSVATTTTTSPTSPAPTMSMADAQAARDSEAERIEKFELGSVPEGYGPGVRDAEPNIFTIVYRALQSDDGHRLSLQVGPPGDDPSATNYVRLGEHDVRGGKPAMFFVVSDHADDAHARHGLTWVETPKSRIAIYALNSDPSFFVRLAESVRPTN